MNDNGEMSAAGVSRRAAAGLAAVSAALHAVMLGHAGSPAAAVLLAAMVSACLYCAYELWQSSTTRAWALVAVMNLAMVAVHMPMSGEHHVTHMAVNPVVPQSMIMVPATVLSMVEAAIAVAVLWYRTRGNARLIGEPE